MQKQDVLKKFEEIPWDKVDFKYGGNWSSGRGGYPLSDDQWFISYVYEDLHADIYPIPKALSDLIQIYQRIGSDEKSNNIRRMFANIFNEVGFRTIA